MQITTYQEALDLFNARLDRGTLYRGVKLRNHTYLVYPDQPRGTEPLWFGVLFHGTIVVKYLRDGSIKLSSGGWKTTTTKQRLNTYTPQRWTIYQKDYAWFLWDSDDEGSRKDIPFRDGMIFAPDGSVSPGGRP
jgi:hypothetical protein